MRLLSVLAVLLVAGVALSQKKDYTNYKFITVFPNNEDEGLMLAQFEIEDPEFDVWNTVKKGELYFDLLLSPEAFARYSEIFKQYNMRYIIQENNMQRVIDAEAKQVAESRMDGRVVGTYPRHGDLLGWMDTVENANSAIVSQYSAGSSNQNRDLRVLVIKVGSPAKRIWFDCGIHAREWISPATCVNLIDKFISDYKNAVPAVVDILSKYELHFMPSLNPDGYEYAHTNDRYWRKNRKINSGSTCVGVDLNRNFPYRWLTGGSSTDPCSDTHAGPKAASEPETQAVINAIGKYNNWAAYYTLHSYGNWFLTAYGHTTALPPDYAVQKATGDTFAAAVKAVYGEIFTVGSTANLLYIATGASSDWGYGDVGLIHSYTIELRPRNGFSTLGFNIAASQIPLVGNEIYAGIKAIINLL